MEQRFVGSSGLQTSVLALGTLHWGEDTDAEEAASLLDTFVAAGGTTVDVTSGMGGGVAVLGGLLRPPMRSELVIVARSGRWGDGRSSVPDLSRRAMLGALDAMLASLGTDHVDVWLAHGWSDDVPLSETLSALQHAQATGRARYVGVGDHRGWQATRAATLCPDVVTVSTPWSLLSREAEAELVPACASMGLGVMGYSALGAGVLTGTHRGGVSRHSRAVVEALTTAANGLGTTPATVALGWLWSRRELATAVVGPRTCEQLRQLLPGSDAATLPPQIVAALDEVSAPGE